MSCTAARKATASSKLQFDAGPDDRKRFERRTNPNRKRAQQLCRSRTRPTKSAERPLAPRRQTGEPAQPAGCGQPQKSLCDLRLPGGIPATVLQNRPDIREAEYQLKASNANIGAARAALYPSISLTGNIGYSSPELDQMIKAPNLGWSIMPSITLPIFNRAKLNRAVDIAEAQQKILIETYQSTVQSAFYEVADALAARQTLAEQYAAQLRGNKSPSAKRLRLEKPAL